MIWFVSPKQWARSTCKVSSLRASYIYFFSVTLAQPKSWHMLAIMHPVHSFSKYLLMHQPLRHADWLSEKGEKKGNEWMKWEPRIKRETCYHRSPQAARLFSSFPVLVWPVLGLRSAAPPPPNPRGVTRKELNMKEMSYPRTYEPAMPSPEGDIEEERGKKLSHHI